ncbi:MAG: S24/S26 family peptidase [Pseudomonadota bacterium]
MGFLDFTLVRIEGQSMEPMLPHGSFALFRSRKAVERGDVVLVDHPEFGTIVKRIYTVSRHGRCHLEGTGRFSTSRRELGSVERARIKGVLLAKLF